MERRTGMFRRLIGLLCYSHCRLASCQAVRAAARRAPAIATRATTTRYTNPKRQRGPRPRVSEGLATLRDRSSWQNPSSRKELCDAEKAVALRSGVGGDDGCADAGGATATEVPGVPLVSDPLITMVDEVSRSDHARTRSRIENVHTMYRFFNGTVKNCKRKRLLKKR
mgnify:CR=1 FL=1